MPIKHLLRIAMLSVGLVAAVAHAQPFPARPVRIVVPFAPGGNVDVTARVVGAAMSRYLNQPVVVENKTGAGGRIGAEAAIKSPADGYTLMMGSNSSLSVAPSLYKDWPYDPATGLVAVSHLTSVPFVLIVRPGLPVKSLAELLALARDKPGSLTMASAGGGSSNHLVGEYFQALTGTSLVHVPYKGAAPALQDVLGGRVDLMFDQLTSSQQFIEQSKVQALAVTSATRWKTLASVPTFAESGVKELVLTNFTGLVAPAGLPADVAATLHRAAVQALQDEQVRKSLASMGVEPVGSTPAQFTELIREDLQRWGKVIRDKNIRID